MSTVIDFGAYKKSRQSGELLGLLNRQFYHAAQSRSGMSVLSFGELRRIYAALEQDEPPMWNEFSNGENLGIDISQLNRWRQKLEEQKLSR
ncbi:MAG: hypothetical protein MRY79_04560 [Alphaproteobacteria bacterium]|nr:hypothetical protein [Alphaproteobacteria bacterium]